jgi:hypothetical protein
MGVDCEKALVATNIAPTMKPSFRIRPSSTQRAQQSTTSGTWRGHRASAPLCASQGGFTLHAATRARTCRTRPCNARVMNGERRHNSSTLLDVVGVSYHLAKRTLRMVASRR